MSPQVFFAPTLCNAGIPTSTQKLRGSFLTLVEETVSLTPKPSLTKISSYKSTPVRPRVSDQNNYQVPSIALMLGTINEKLERLAVRVGAAPSIVARTPTTATL